MGAAAKTREKLEASDDASETVFVKHLSFGRHASFRRKPLR